MHCTRKNEMTRPFLKGVEACKHSHKCNESLFLEICVCRVIVNVVRMRRAKVEYEKGDD